MANNIKGLTVEIGGDTTKLGKALEDVNKKGRDLSQELGEINKLLKLDPKNTDLLKQKQKVLADAVANTATKLDKLKEAEKQVQKQFERGEASEEQVRALQREIIATEKKMAGYEKAVKETNKQLKNHGKTTDDTKEKTNKFGDAAKKTGSVVVTSFKAAAAVIAAAGAALVASAEATREYRQEMGKLDTAFTTAGHSSEAATKTYKALQGVLGETDQAVEAANHLAQLTKSEEELQKWTDICTGVYATFGASLPIEGLTEAANETAKVGQVTGPLADALSWAGVSEDKFNMSLAACNSEQERQTLIMETLNGLYSEAATKYQETNAEIIRANEANEAWTASLAEIGGAIEPILSDVKLLGASLLTELVPGVQDAANALRGLLNGEDGAGAAFGEALSGIATQVLSMVTDMLPQVVEAATSLITSLVETILEQLPALLETGVEVIAALIDGVTTAIPDIVAAITDMIPKLVDAVVAGLPQLTEGAVALLLALVDAVSLILPALIDAVPAIVLSIVDTLVGAIPQLLDGAVKFLLAIVNAIPVIVAKLYPLVPTIVDAVISGLLDNIPALVDGAIQLFMAILDAVPETNAALIEQGPVIVATIASSLLKAIPQLIAAGGQLLQGLVDGMLDFDLGGAIKNIGGSVVSGFKKVFDIHSPSRVMAEMGELLDEGLAVGIEDNANAPEKAMRDMSNDVIDTVGRVDGVSIERQVTHAYSASVAESAAQSSSTLSKLDQILKAIERGQILTIDGNALVGATANTMNNALGQRRILAERGAV